MASPDIRQANLARLAAGPLALTYGLGAFAVARGPGILSTYAGRSALIGALALVAGIALASIGVISSFGQPVAPIGALALIAGFVWFAPMWVGWADGPLIVRSLGMVVAGFAFPVLLHLVLAYPSGRVQPALARMLVAAVYLEATLSAIGRALFRDPFLVLNCWDNCSRNVFLVHPLPGVVRGIQFTDVWFTGTAAAALAALCIWRLATATRPARHAVWPILTAGLVVAGANIARSIALARAPDSENPADALFLAIFVVLCTGVLVLAAGMSWTALRARIQRRAVGRIVTGLGEAPAPGSLESALAHAVGDPELRIAYWLPGSPGYVDAWGHTLAPPMATRGREITTLVRDGRPVAVVTHTAAVPELEREIGAAVRLALENERLQAEVLHQLESLRASRTRIIEAGDAARRRLERDLHDGAQQRLLALSYDLRVARVSADADGDAATSAVLADAIDEVLRAHADLRELAHGIYPAILAEAGLGPALATLADTDSLLVKIEDVPQGRFPAPVESAAYLVVSGALADAAGRGAARAHISARREDGHLMIVVADDGIERRSEMLRVADRVGAIGGTTEIGPTTIIAQIPCE